MWFKGSKCEIKKGLSKEDYMKNVEKCFEAEFPGVIALIRSIGLSVERNLKSIDHNYVISVERLREDLKKMLDPKRKKKEGDDERIKFLEALVDLVENARLETKIDNESCSADMMTTHEKLVADVTSLLFSKQIAKMVESN